MKTYLSITIIILLLGANFVTAQDKAAYSIELNNSDIDNFIKNYPKIVEEFDDLEYDYDDESDIKDFMEDLEDYEEANNVVKKYGYDDLTEFVGVTWTIAMSYASIKMDQGGVPAMNEAIQEIENNPNMSAEQKEMALMQIKQVMGAMESLYQPMTNPANIETVKPYADKLENLFDDIN